MKQKIKLHLYIKIFLFVLSAWIYHFNNDRFKYNKYLEQNHILKRILSIRNCRLLAKCKKTNNTNTVDLIVDIPRNGVYEKRDIPYNDKRNTTKNKQSCRNSLNNASDHRQATKNRSCIYETKKYSRLEKKIFKELDYTDFLKNNRTVRDSIYKKIIFKKYGLRIALPLLLFLFLLIVCIIELTLGLSGKGCLLSYLGLKKEHLETLSKDGDGTLSTFVNLLKKLTGFWEHSGIFGTKDACDFCKEVSNAVSNACILGRFFRILICFVPFFILCFTFISWIIYYHKKFKKYEKIKFRKR
ncbi:hypothetical protein MKS88_001254 [Plasmodium brasilianum]|uniref:Uncharacterized protein n=1 Tax=Plasmodium brasilianum TaxID=5824 RepID=A0ACB9YDQ2_PLABR|nr:hypothetical protein MKS88_001254 [Plasmodium brasilianum]